jgi:hypothetical protein
VLEHVSDPGFPAGIVHGANVDVSMERHDRGFVALNDQKSQAVGERELGDLFLEFFERLAGEEKGDTEKE